jgi:hypothetical protein
MGYSDVARDYPRIPPSFTSEKNTLQGHIFGGDNARALVVVAWGKGRGADSYLVHIQRLVDNDLRVFAYGFTKS